MISVVVPVFNVEKYLDECIQSILCQTYQNFEIILIDDGSSDNSPEICKKYVARDNRVKLVSITNSGVNYARKVGVENALGEYIMFVDSDDTIDCYALENMVRAKTRLDYVDIVVAHMPYEYHVVNGNEYLIDLLNSTCNVAMFFKLYKTNVLQKYFLDIPRRFKYGEDLLQNINIARFVQSVAYCSIEYYNYRIVETSVSHTFSYSQVYENEFHSFLSELLNNREFINSLSNDIVNKIVLASYRCRLNGFCNVALTTNSFDFSDPNFVNLKHDIKPYVAQLSVNEKILLYSSHWSCIMQLKCYREYCRFKQWVKRLINYK